MADLRFDPVSGVWVAIAQHRNQRPVELTMVDHKTQQLVCPFCAGNEDQTPEAIAEYDAGENRMAAGDGPRNWQVRVIPNKYPSLAVATANPDCGPYDCWSQDGVQELVIPTPRHVASLSELTEAESQLCWLACQQRVAVFRDDPRVEHITVFMNCRSAAGATLEHIHWQVIGSPLLNEDLLQRNRRNDQCMEQRGETVIGQLLAWEMEQSLRIVAETPGFVMVCPYASRFSYQVWIIPRSSDAVFERSSEASNRQLGKLCSQYVKKLEQIMLNPAYNLLVHLAPNRHQENEHWMVEIFPRTNQIAGYELGTGFWINPVSPETAASQLR
jgi:UDPglucose--hexose-1-phosphate uridylyltransferase